MSDLKDKKWIALFNGRIGMNEKQKQVVQQYQVVAELGEIIASLAKDHIRLLEADLDLDDGLLDVKGNITAAWMEQLGDILNGADAVTDEDKWMEPIFEKAQEMFPQGE